MVQFLAGARDLFSKKSISGLGLSQLRVQWVPGVPSPGVKQLWREVDHANAKVKNVWSYFHSCIYLHSLHRDMFTF